MRRKTVDNLTLTRWRSLNAGVPRAVADNPKQDADFRPRQSHSTTRWHATVVGNGYEILGTGPRFLDTLANLGGGGAVDLVMHLIGVDFKVGVKVLQDRRL